VEGGSTNFASDEQCQALQSEWDKAQEERDRLREELKKAKEQLTKEKEELEAKNRRLLQNEKRARKVSHTLSFLFFLFRPPFPFPSAPDLLQNKEELEEVMKKQDQIFDMSMVEFRKHFLIHLRGIPPSSFPLSLSSCPHGLPLLCSNKNRYEHVATIFGGRPRL
jgi:DNA repair exonuclease SbcCD ATPase subunit